MKRFLSNCKSQSVKIAAITTLTAAFQMSIHAHSYSNPQENALTNQCSLDLRSLVATLKANEKNIALTISNLGSGCFSKLFLLSPSEINDIFKKENIYSVITAGKDEIDNFNGRSLKTLNNYAKYLNIGFFLERQNPRLNLNYHSDKSIKKDIAILTDYYAQKLYKLGNDNIQFNQIELFKTSESVFNLVRSARAYAESIYLIQYVTGNKLQTDLPLYSAIEPIQKVLSSTHDAGGIFYKSKETRKIFKKIVHNLIRIANEDENILEETLYVNYIRELGKFLRYPTYKKDIIKSLTGIINKSSFKNANGITNPKAKLIAAVAALEEYNVVNSNNCNNFKDKDGINICDSKANLSNNLFPKRYKFDEGKIVIFSSLDEKEATRQYLAMKEVEALYKRAIQSLDPISNDPNERLQIFIYKDFADYMKYKSYLSNSDNEVRGGEYHEFSGTFYTHAGDAGLEERVRHEYVHYLNGRYLEKGIHGDNTLFERKWNRMFWIEDGSAEFYAGATQSDNFINRGKNFNAIDLENISTIKEITHSAYGTHSNNVVYDQSSALYSYLYNKQFPLFSELISAYKDNNVVKFDHIIEKISDGSYDGDFKNYIREIKSGVLEDIHLKTNSQEFFNVTDMQKIENDMKRAGLNINNCEVVASSEYKNSQARFACFGSLQGSAIDYYTANQAVNRSIKQLLNIDTRYNFTNCAFGENLNSKRKLYCEGPLTNASFSQLSLERQKAIIASNEEQKLKTFKNSTEHFYFFTGNTLSDSLYDNSRRQEGQEYIYIKSEDPSSGQLTVSKNGDLTYTNTDENFYDPVTGSINISDKEIDALDDNSPLKITLKMLKFKKIDQRMFANVIYNDKRGYAAGSLYRNEYSTAEINKDGFRVFSDKFRYQDVNDFEFEVVEKPAGARAQIYSRYMLDYHNPNKKPDQDDIIKVKISLHDWEPQIFEMRISSNKPTLPDSFTKGFDNLPTHVAEFKLQAGRMVSSMVYYPIEHLLTAGYKYSYEVVKGKGVQCGDFGMADYGGFSYRQDKPCESDNALIYVTKVTNSGLTPIFKIKAEFK